jgi:hypothetical protein
MAEDNQWRSRAQFGASFCETLIGRLLKPQLFAGKADGPMAIRVRFTLKRELK